MRPTRCAAMLAAVVSGGALIPASAQAFENRGYGPSPDVRVVAVHPTGLPSSSSSDLAMVGVGAVAGIALLGAGSARRARLRGRAR
jgi:hypothetical protein